MRWALSVSLPAFVALAVCACSSGHRSASEHGIVVSGLPNGIPRPPFARVLPADYRARRVWYARLTGQSVPEAIVTSVGPPQGSLGFHSADLQVLSWDSLALRWIVLFDGQKTQPPDQLVSPATSNLGAGSSGFSGDEKPPPLLDPAANVTLGPLRFPRLLRGKGAQLVFSSFANYGGSGYPGELVVVDFHGGIADVVYFWSGDGGVRYRLGTESRVPVIRARASYWTAADAHCCPIRTYAFTVGRQGDGSVAELSDERPWLGVVVRPTDENDNAAPLEIVDVVAGSPAAGKIEQGDLLSAVGSARRRGARFAIGPVLYDQFAKLNAGDTVRLHLLRNGTPVAVTLTLGSLNDASVGEAYVPNNGLVAAL